MNSRGDMSKKKKQNKSFKTEYIVLVHNVNIVLRILLCLTISKKEKKRKRKKVGFAVPFTALIIKVIIMYAYRESGIPLDWKYITITIQICR